MATKIRGITIEIGADASEALDAIKDINSDIKATSSQIKDVNKLLKLDPTNTELLAQKTQLLQEQIGNCTEKLNELKSAQKTMDENGVDKNSAQYQALQREIISTEQELKSLKDTVGSSSAELAKISAVTGEIGEKMESAGKKMSIVSAGIVALGAASVKAFKDVDEGADIVIKKTGATGEAAESLEKSYKNVAQNIVGEWEDIGAAIGDVNTLFGLTGQDLEDLSEEFLKFAEINDMDVSAAVDGVDKALKTFNVDQSEAQNVMGLLSKTAQDTGISMDDMLGLLQSSGPALKEMGLDIDEAITLMGNFEAAGIDSSDMLTKLQKAAAYYNSEGLSMEEGLSDLIERLQNSETAADATAEAYEIFGKKGGLAFVTAAQEGKISISDLETSLEDYSDVVDETYQQTLDGTDKMALAWQNMQLGLSELGEVIGNALAPIMEKITSVIQSVTEWFGNLDEGTQTMIVTIGGIVAAIGPLLVIGGKLMTGISNITGALSKMGSTGFGPIGLVVAGVAAATAAIIAWKDALYKAALKANPFTDTLSDLKTRNDELATSIGESKAKYEEETTASEADAYAAEVMYDRLQSLIEAYDGSAEAQGEIQTIVNELNKIVPDLGLAWDDTTNSLNLNTDEIYNQIAAMKAQAQVAALTDLYTESLKEQYLAEKNLTDAQNTLINMANQYGISAEIVQRALDGDTTAVLDYSAAITDSIGHGEEANAATKLFTDAIVATKEAMTNAAEAVHTATFAEEELGNAMTEVANAAENSAKSIETKYQETFGTAMPEILQTAVDAAKDAGYSVPQNIVDGLLNGELSVEQAATKITNYLDQKQAAAEHGTETADAYVTAETEEIESSEPAVDKAVKKSCKPMDQTDTAADYGEWNADAYVDATTKKIIYSEEVIEDTAESAMAGLDQYDTSYDYGDNSGQGYADGFENTADEAAAATKVVYDEYVDGMDGLPDEMNTSGSTAGQKLDSGFGDNSGSISKTIDSIWNLYYNSLGVSLKGKMWEWGYAAGGALGRGLKETNISGSIGTVIDNIQSAMWDVYVMMYNAGGDAGRGFYNGWGAWADNIRIQAYNIAVDAANAARNALSISSPSKVMKQIGEYTGEGLALGIEDSASDVYAAMNAITDQISQTQPEMTVGVNALNAQAVQGTGMNDMAETLNVELGAVESLLQQYLPYLAQQTDIVLDDGILAGHMAPMMNDALTRIQKKAVRG